MRAMMIHDFGGLDALKLEELPSPTPGPGEIRIAVRAAGVNFADTLQIVGKYQHKPPLPFAPGMEVAGEVVAVGEGASRLKVGDRVFAAMRAGAFAEECVVPADHATRIPDGMDDVTAAAFPIVYGTSHLALTHRVTLRKGEVLLVHGAAGGVGLTAVEIGKILGATVVATAGSDEKLALAKEYGADHLINYSTESIRDRVKELVGGADVVFDPVGGDAFAQSLRCTNYEGRIVIVGFASGTIPQIPANYLLVKSISAVGYSWSTYRYEKPQVMQDSFDELLRWYGEGRLKPHVSHTFPLAQTADALRTLLARKSTGKVVITMR